MRRGGWGGGGWGQPSRAAEEGGGGARGSRLLQAASQLAHPSPPHAATGRWYLAAWPCALVLFGEGQGLVADGGGLGAGSRHRTPAACAGRRRMAPHAAGTATGSRSHPCRPRLCRCMSFIPDFRNFRVFSLIALIATTFTAWVRARHGRRPPLRPPGLSLAPAAACRCPFRRGCPFRHAAAALCLSEAVSDVPHLPGGLSHCTYHTGVTPIHPPTHSPSTVHGSGGHHWLGRHRPQERGLDQPGAHEASGRQLLRGRCVAALLGAAHRHGARRATLLSQAPAVHPLMPGAPSLPSPPPAASNIIFTFGAPGCGGQAAEAAGRCARGHAAAGSIASRAWRLAVPAPAYPVPCPRRPCDAARGHGLDVPPLQVPQSLLPLILLRVSRGGEGEGGSNEGAHTYSHW